MINPLIAMQCLSCNRDYNQKDQTPRLLVVCGHSLCEGCCLRLHYDGKIHCPSCSVDTYVESPVLLPKNLALLSACTSQSIPERTCVKHSKKYEAFCEKESVLLCIDCILQDGHKNHEVQAVRHAYDRLQDKNMRRLQKLTVTAEKIEEYLAVCERNKGSSEDSYMCFRQSIGELFREMHELLAREEQTILSRQREQFTAGVNKFTQKSNKYCEQLEGLVQKMAELREINKLEEFQFLSEVAHRQSIPDIIVEEPLKASTYAVHWKEVVMQVNKKMSALQQKPKGKINQQKCAVQPVVSGVQPVVSGVQSHTNSNYSSVNPKSGVKAVRKSALTPQNSNMIGKQKRNKREVSRTKTPHVESVASNDSNPLDKISRVELNEMDFKQSLCHSFISNMTWLLSERKSIYIVGGFNEHSDCILKLSLPSLTCEEVARLSSNRSKFGCAAVDGRIVMIGGKRGAERLSDGEVFDLATQQWSEYSSMDRTRSGFGIVQIGEELAFVGGNDGENLLASMDCLNLKTGEWRKRDPMHETRDQLAVVVGKHGCIYAIGGFGGKDNEPLKTVEMYDPRVLKWIRLPSMNCVRRALAAAVLADGVYAIGGFDEKNCLSSVERYEEGDRGWTMIADMNKPRCTHSAVAVFDFQEIYVFGGFDRGALDSVERYSVVTNQWEVVCTLPMPRFMHASLLFDSK